GAEPIASSWRLPAGVQVSALPGFAEGDWWIQDAAAALPATLLNVQPGEAVLDLCAAPGGKTMQLAAMGADKKRIGGRLRFVLPRALGAVELMDDVPTEAVLAVLAELA
ncbi:MAG TPA: hypothetical protein PK170_02870, partial [Anaerolineae bacterium]|nr:hypothetical protein [Anaerolineae bacterium]